MAPPVSAWSRSMISIRWRIPSSPISRPAALVQTGDDVLIGGIIVLGSSAQKVIVRAIGPSLGEAGVTGALQDPILELHRQLMAASRLQRQLARHPAKPRSLAPPCSRRTIRNQPLSRHCRRVPAASATPRLCGVRTIAPGWRWSNSTRCHGKRDGPMIDPGRWRRWRAMLCHRRVWSSIGMIRNFGNDGALPSRLAYFPSKQAQEVRVGKSPAVPLPNDNEVERRNDVKPLVAGTDAGDQIARRIAAETSVVPILARPFRCEHVFEIELPPAGRGAIVPPA